MVVVLPLLVVLLQVVVDVFIQPSQIVVHKRYVDALVHLQHLFKELEIHVLHLQEIPAIPDDTIVDEVFDFILRQLQGIIVLQGSRRSFLKHLLHQDFLPFEDTQQVVYGFECIHKSRSSYNKGQITKGKYSLFSPFSRIFLGLLFTLHTVLSFKTEITA